MSLRVYNVTRTRKAFFSENVTDDEYTHITERAKATGVSIEDIQDGGGLVIVEHTIQGIITYGFAWATDNKNLVIVNRVNMITVSGINSVVVIKHAGMTSEAFKKSVENANITLPYDFYIEKPSNFFWQETTVKLEYKSLIIPTLQRAFGLNTCEVSGLYPNLMLTCHKLESNQASAYIREMVDLMHMVEGADFVRSVTIWRGSPDIDGSSFNIEMVAFSSVVGSLLRENHSKEKTEEFLRGQQYEISADGFKNIIAISVYTWPESSDVLYDALVSIGYSRVGDSRVDDSRVDGICFDGICFDGICYMFKILGYLPWLWTIKKKPRLQLMHT